MRRFAAVMAVVLSVLLISTSANASSFIDDDFNQPAFVPGNLVGQQSWDTHSGTGYPVQVLPGSICYDEQVPGDGFIELTHGVDSREDVNKLLGVTMGPGDKWYAGFCVVVWAPEPLQDDNYFAHFKTSGTYYANKVFDGPANTPGNDFTFGFQAAGGGEDASVFWTEDFQYGTCHRIITSYEYDTGIGEMWVDPICELGPDGNPKITDTGYSANALEAYAFRQDNYYPDPDPTQWVDSLDVATTWAEACVVCVPEPVTLSLLVVGGLLVMRRRR